MFSQAREILRDGVDEYARLRWKRFSICVQCMQVHVVGSMVWKKTRQRSIHDRRRREKIR